MIRSMTGYGREQMIVGEREIMVEIRSVNHRYFEFSARVPRVYGYIEEKLKSTLKESISRGKVEVNVQINMLEGKPIKVSVDKNTAYEYLGALREANNDLDLEDDITLSKLMKFPDIFTVQKPADDEEQLWNDVSTVVSKAVERFVSMRETEGKNIGADFHKRLDLIEQNVLEIEKRSPQVVAEYQARLNERLDALLADKKITADPDRVLQEVAIFADRVAITEEIVRLKSHIRQFRVIMDAAQPVGRKLDFLIQEFNREANTIASKANDFELAKIVVDVKAEIEKIREQVQNIE